MSTKSTADAELTDEAREWLIIAASAPCVDAGVERVSRAIERRFAGRLTDEQADIIGEMLGRNVWALGAITPGRLEKLAAMMLDPSAVRALDELRRELRADKARVHHLAEAIEYARTTGGDFETVRQEVCRLERFVTEVAA